MSAKRGKVGAVRAVRLRGIGIAAASLEVHPQHLRMVVMGERVSASLLGRVREKFPELLAPGGKTWKEANA